MTLSKALIDTDILSAIMKQNPIAIKTARSYLTAHKRFSLSIITRYEILRGLKAKNATKQIHAFDVFCSKNEIIDLSELVIVQAANIYADLRKQGTTIGDADILIAATAMVNNLIVVTNNINHFGRIKNLKTQNWLK